MRALVTFLLVGAGLALSASQSLAQCCYVSPPRAPDMLNPGFYYMNPYAVIYGPNHNVRPPFPPFQGMVLGPPSRPAAPFNPEQPAMFAAQAAALGAFPRHLYARSPRDFFMIDTDPRTSPYNYGYASPITGPTGVE